MKVGQVIVVDGWREAVVCDVRPDGSFYAMCGDNCRERFTPNDPRAATPKSTWRD